MNEQRIFRVVKNKNYSTIDNRVLRDMRLSWQAKGLMGYILTLPDDWKIYPSEIYKHSDTGINGTRSALRELKKYGYLSWKRSVSENGKYIGYDYYIHEEPILPRDEIHYTLKPLKNNVLTCDEKPYTSKPRTEKPYTSKRMLLSTDILSTDITNDVNETKPDKDNTPDGDYNVWKKEIHTHYENNYKNVYGVEYEFKRADWSVLATKKNVTAKEIITIINAWFMDDWGKKTGHRFTCMCDQSTFNRLRKLNEKPAPRVSPTTGQEIKDVGF